METMNRLVLNNVALKRKNFAGRITDLNDRGNRECLVVLNADNAHDLGFEDVTEMVNELKSDNWAIKRFNATDENPEPDAYIPARVVFYERERSNIFLKIDNGAAQLLTEDTVGLVDEVKVLNCNAILKKHYYDSHGRQGYNVRIQSMEIIAEDDRDEICARNLPY